MSRITIYVIKEITSSFLFIFSLMTSIVWLSQALKYLELMTSDNVTVSTYIFYTLLLLPKLFSITLPVSIFISIIYTLNKLRIDSELIIFGSTGNSNRDILLKPISIIGMLFFLIMLFLSVFVVPWASSELRKELIEIRSSGINSTILKEKKFITPDKNLTVFFKEVRNKELLGILIHDRSSKKEKTYIADKGFLEINDDKSQIYLFNGSMQIYDEDEKKISEIKFDSYAIDLSNFNRNKENYYFADEISTFGLINLIGLKIHTNEHFASLHNRFIRAIYIFNLVFLPLMIFKFIRKPDDKSGMTISSILLLGLSIKYFEITMENLLISNNSMILVSYLSPLLITAVIFISLFINVNYIKNIILRIKNAK